MSVALATFHRFPRLLMNGKFGDLHLATIYIQLSNTLPTKATATREADLAAGVGTDFKIAGSSKGAGGTLSGAKYIMKLTDATTTAAGSPVGPFQYAIMYNYTDAQKHLLGYYNYGSAITLQVGDSFTVDFDAINGVLTIGQ